MKYDFKIAFEWNFEKLYLNLYQLTKINPYCLSELLIRSDGSGALEKRFLELTQIILLDHFIL